MYRRSSALSRLRRTRGALATPRVFFRLCQGESSHLVTTQAPPGAGEFAPGHQAKLDSRAGSGPNLNRRPVISKAITRT
jgi:hypothetical protein